MKLLMVVLYVLPSELHGPLTPIASPPPRKLAKLTERLAPLFSGHPAVARTSSDQSSHMSS